MKMILFYLVCYWQFVFVLLADENFQYLGNYYKRKTYQNANFEELFEDFTSDDQIALDECRYMINEGAAQYFTICDTVERNKQIANEVVEIRDKVDLISVPRGHKDFIFHSAHGLSNISIGEAELSTFGNRPYFEIRSKTYIPSITLKGIVEVGGVNQSLDYEIDDILYINLQRKKVINGDFEIKLCRTSERFQFNTSKIIIKGMVSYDTEYRLLESEIAKDTARYLSSIVEYVKTVSRNVTLFVDNDYLLATKYETVQKISRIVSKTVTFFGIVKSNIPRFSFYDTDSNLYYDLISGVFEMDMSKANVSIRVIADGEFELTSPTEGSLVFFLTEKNCTDSCYTYGDRGKLRNPVLKITFVKRKIEKVAMTFELEPGNGTDNEHYLRKPSVTMSNVVLLNVSKILSDRLLTYLKLFLR